jgi:AraC-like DNA-binding protein
MARPVAGETRAIVHPSQAFRKFSYQAWAPDPPVSRAVNRFWRTEWNLTEPFAQTIVPHPAVNLVVQADSSITVTGVLRHNDERTLDGSGWALGALFRPGGFRLVHDVPMRTLVDLRVPAQDIFGDNATRLAQAIVAAPSVERALAAFAAFISARLPEQVTPAEELAALVEAAASEDPPVTRASELAERMAVSQRTLQRLFAEHVGVGPKWVLDRYRVHAVAAQTQAPPTSWAEVAPKLGYTDQAHLTTDFGAHFGLPPGAYIRAEEQASLDRSDGPA